MATVSMRARQATLPAIVAFWVFRGVLRQIGFDVKAGSRSSKELFQDWMRRKWQEVPRPIRVSLFAIGATARAGYRAARHADKTISTGVRIGYAEGRARHQEFVELRKLRTEWPKQSTHAQDVVGQIKDQRAARKDEHRTVAQQLAEQRRAEKVARGPVQWPGPVVHEAPLTVRDAGLIAPYPGDPDGGDYTVSHEDLTVSDCSKEHAKALAKWLKWRYPDAPAAKVTAPKPQSGSASGTKPPENKQNGETNMTAPSGVHGGDVTSVADLRSVYEGMAAQMSAVQDHLTAMASALESQAASFEAAAGGVSSEGFDDETVREAQAVLDALIAVAAKAHEAAAAADNAQGVIAGAHQGLERHRLMEEAVAGTGKTAHRTSAYAPR